MLPILKIIWYEALASKRPDRVPEPSEAMEDPEQIRSYVKAYEWGGPTSALQLHHLRELSRMIRPGDTVLDLACGPGPLLLELAPLYPECRFIGVDLSGPMLAVLREQAAARQLTNIETLQEDVRELPSLRNQKVDMVISTSAFHHLPDIECLGAAFERVNSVLDSEGGFYMFDFGLLRSARVQQLLVAEVAKSAPPITVQDYAHSLRAAFPIEEVISVAHRFLQRTFRAHSSSFVDFFYFLQTEPRTQPTAKAKQYVADVLGNCSASTKLEYLMIRALRRGR